jgi:hypothetical protein
LHNNSTLIEKPFSKKFQISLKESVFLFTIRLSSQYSPHGDMIGKKDPRDSLRQDKTFKHRKGGGNFVANETNFFVFVYVCAFVRLLHFLHFLFFPN